MNVLCMVGCCYCTTMDCYADKDAVVYYSKGSFNGPRGNSRVNGSDYEKRYHPIEESKQPIKET